MMRGSPLIALLVLACTDPSPQADAYVTGPCEPPTPWADLPAEVEETSGVAASRVHLGVFWTHNDSGGDAAIFALDSTGTILARVRVREATNRDWEDIAAAPCEPGAPAQCLYLADTGDNLEQRESVVVFRIPEPDPFSDTVTTPADRLEMSYPDGPSDAEALYITDAGLHLVTKGRSRSIGLYRLSLPYDPRNTVLTRVQQLAPPPTSMSAQVTGAAASPDGRVVVLRTYSGLRFFEPDADSLRPLGETADFLGPAQPLGEGVDFIGPGRLVLTGEAGGRRPATIAAVRCDLRPRTTAPSAGGDSTP